MLVAIRTALWAELEGTIDLFGREEYLFIVLLAWLAVSGAGAVSLDAVIARFLSASPAHRREASRLPSPRGEALRP
jgi:uncharacterized membrane protein YedE/YeeE